MNGARRRIVAPPLQDPAESKIYSQGRSAAFDFS
jgi:hypothetical protein